ncbi:hypothetical protein D3880_15890 [Pseudomonas cavernae]|uniref:TauD/TfdA-like domain-containing protein n=1 Tax=Pseudomonas cavernae TaxID=2320867 RepID=A0A385Z4R9_9PSED|nr:TauD/TfdA family dioxygenase [Pseudomonas cavernae]AYC33744.1 hypothetical protein D3880_15890 [Pseudomonas cavernae]
MNTLASPLSVSPALETDFALPAVHPALGAEVRVQLHPQGIPLFVTPASTRLKEDFAAFHAWFVAHEQAFEDLLKVYGALRFRGFPIRETADFSTMMAHYPSADMGYNGGGTPRAVVAGKVFEATRFDKELTLPLHQEMSYLPDWPLKVAFYCRVAPSSGGATNIGDIRRLEALVPQQLFEQVRQRGVLYKRNFRDGRLPTDGWHSYLTSLHRPWQQAFYTDDPAEAQSACEKMGLEWQWLEDGSLQTSYRNSGFITHPVLGSRHWFNQIATLIPLPSGSQAWNAFIEHYGEDKPRPNDVQYGDGTRIPRELVEVLRLAYAQATVSEPWQAGEVLLLDNVLTCHGRAPFEGTRDVQVQLIGSCSND